MDERLQQFEKKMEKAYAYLEADYLTIRAGRASAQAGPTPTYWTRSAWTITGRPPRCSR